MFRQQLLHRNGRKRRQRKWSNQPVAAEAEAEGEAAVAVVVVGRVQALRVVEAGVEAEARALARVAVAKLAVERANASRGTNTAATVRRGHGGTKRPLSSEAGRA